MTTITGILDDCDTPCAIEGCYAGTTDWKRITSHRGKPVPTLALSDAISEVNRVCGDHQLSDPVFSLRVVHAHTGERLWPPLVPLDA